MRVAILLLIILYPILNHAQSDYRYKFHLYRTETYVMHTEGWRLMAADTTTKGRLFVSDYEITLINGSESKQYKIYWLNREPANVPGFKGWWLDKQTQALWNPEHPDFFLIKIYDGNRLIKRYYWG